MRADLTFASPELEKEFNCIHTQRNAKLHKQFHCGRALTWAAILLRMLANRDWSAVGWLALGTLTSVAPAFADRVLPEQVHYRWRIPIEIADNMLQVVLGCYTHGTIYPAPARGQPSAFQMAAVLLTGNGVAWLLFCCLWGSLPFRYALPQQGALTIVLLLFNNRLCKQNPVMQLAYAALASNAARRAQLLLGRLFQLQTYKTFSAYYAAGRSCSAAVLAAPHAAREAVRQACIAATGRADLPGAAAVAEAAPTAIGAEAAAIHGVELCLQYQPLSLLLCGFVLPTAYIFASELRMRRALLARHRAAAAAGGRTPAEYTPQREHLPGLAEYCYFAVPAVAAMWVFVVAN